MRFDSIWILFSLCYDALGHFLFKFDLVCEGLEKMWSEAGLGLGRREGWGLTAFGSSLRKLFRIHFLSPLVAPPLLAADYLELFPNFFPVFFMASRLFYLNVLISFSRKVSPLFFSCCCPCSALVVVIFMGHRLSFGLWLV